MQGEGSSPSSGSRHGSLVIARLIGAVPMPNTPQPQAFAPYLLAAGSSSQHLWLPQGLP